MVMVVNCHEQHIYQINKNRDDAKTPKRPKNQLSDGAFRPRRRLVFFFIFVSHSTIRPVSFNDAQCLRSGRLGDEFP
jgi:hypothetical protein